MMRVARCAVLIVAAVGAVPVDAAEMRFTAVGTVSTMVGLLTPTGNIPIGSDLNVTFDFDTNDAALFELDEVSAVYDLPVSHFSGSIGSYQLSVDPDPRFVPAVVISRGFSFLGGSSSEPSLSYTFYLPRAVSATGGSTGRFILSPDSRETLALSAIFRSDISGSLGINQLRDPLTADRLTFAYSANDPVRRLGGSLGGTYVGNFVKVGAVPEPDTWAMMILGMSVVGLAMRRCRAVKTTISYA
jgi:hypothetical protein